MSGLERLLTPLATGQPRPIADVIRGDASPSTPLLGQRKNAIETLQSAVVMRPLLHRAQARKVPEPRGRGQANSHRHLRASAQWRSRSSPSRRSPQQQTSRTGRSPQTPTRGPTRAEPLRRAQRRPLLASLIEPEAVPVEEGDASAGPVAHSRDLTIQELTQMDQDEPPPIELLGVDDENDVSLSFVAISSRTHSRKARNFCSLTSSRANSVASGNRWNLASK